MSVLGDSEYESDDSSLVRAAQCDPTAFLSLHQRYEDRVYQYARVRTSNAEDAADITQQVFLQAFDSLPRYRASGSPFAAWLFRIAHNLVVDYRRRKKNTVAWDELGEWAQPVSSGTPEDWVVRWSAIEQIRGLLIELSPEDQELVALRFNADLTLEEIAVATGSSKSAVHRSLTRVLQVLKERYQDE